MRRSNVNICTERTQGHRHSECRMCRRCCTGRCTGAQHSGYWISEQSRHVCGNLWKKTICVYRRFCLIQIGNCEYSSKGNYTLICIEFDYNYEAAFVCNPYLKEVLSLSSLGCHGGRTDQRI